MLYCCHCRAGQVLATSVRDPKLIIVLMSVSAITRSRTEPLSHSAKPPAALLELTWMLGLQKSHHPEAKSSLSFRNSTSENS